ncbi:alpha/beta hydrolase [Rhizobium sp. SG_E_25_P2]|uniref:alpha/beta hydrolase n=1 Tax=Rhizobium sp. SG_E_25_P2 TaxID=2879942 RepID=UPI002476F1DD|nr:alpha/beta hydrolase [Rhizobium sp. SG_E_25_P2]
MMWFARRLGDVFSLALVISLCCLAADRSHAEDEERHPVSKGKTVYIDGAANILAEVENPKGSLLLLAGGSERLNVRADGSFTDQTLSAFVRNRDRFAKSGFNTLLVDKETNLREAVEYMKRLKRPVTIVAISNATRRTAKALVQGAKPDRVVLASGELNAQSGPLVGVADILQDPGRLPPTLVIHHRKDACRVTNPAGVAPFHAWAGDGVRKVFWIDGGAEGTGGCASLGYHGFGGRDAELVAEVVNFAAGE